MTSPVRFLRTRVASLSVYCAIRFVAIFSLFAVVGAAAHAAPATTATTLTISSNTVAYKTPIILTATVTSGGSPVTSGLVLFCDATAVYCENNSALLAQVQLTASNATAIVKIGSGPLGIHKYKAVYRANNSYNSSSSNTVSYTVQGTYQTGTDLASSGVVGDYSLASTVSGLGAITSPGPTGTVTFRDASVGNNVLGTENLGTPVLTNTFTQAPNSPFTIGDGLTTSRSLVVASSYLDGDNNIDVITGDADHVVTVLLGNGDGTFQPKVNYPGCPQINSGKEDAVQKILLADFNRDGVTDVALGCSDRIDGGVGILLGNGDGSFRPVIWQQTGDLAGLAMGDFDGDGFLDLAITHRSNMNVAVMLGNGDGTFHAPTIIASTSSFARNIVVADFDGDGKDDIGYAYAMPSPSTLAYLYVALGKGDGTFKTPVLRASSIGEFLTVGDINGDNVVDIVSSTASLRGPDGSSHIANSMFVLIGNGDSTFQPTVAYVSDIPSDPHLADVNGDGDADIIAGGSYGALVYHGNGDGTFQAYDEPVIGGFALTYSVNAGDYNNDGNADLIGTDADNPKAAVALSEVKQAADAVALTGVAVFPLGSGIHNVDALYSGDSIYMTSTAPTVPLRAAPVSTTLTMSVAPVSAAIGQSITLTATLTPYTVGPPTTTTDGQSINFYSGSTVIGTGTLSSGVASFTTTSLPEGNSVLKSSYPGDINYITSTSSTTTVIVSNVVLTTSPNPSNYGQSVTMTATVSAGATGSVTFKDGSTALGVVPISGSTASLSTSSLVVGSHNITAVYSGDGSHATATSAIVTQVVSKINPIMSVTTLGQSTYLSNVTITATVPSDATGSITFTSGSITLGTAAISSGSASISTTAMPVGNNTITATYAGDTNYNAGTATTTRAVTKASPSSTLTSSLNPSSYGSSVTFTDTLPTTVTGTVTFTSDSTVLGTTTVANGVATLTASNLPVGSSTITATYNGDGNNNTAVSTLPQVINKVTPTVVLTSSLNPAITGQSVILTATLPTNVTGTITFLNGSTQFATITITNGVASTTSTSLPIGTNTITAQYNGDANNQTASAILSQVVNKADTTLTLASSANPTIYGGSVTLTATLTSTGSIGTTGTVSFSIGSTTLGTGNVNGGVATFSTTSLPVGGNVITASYGGDTNNNASTGTVTQTVNKANSTLSLTSSLNPSTVSQPVTFTATLPTGVTGTVAFTSGSTSLGTSTISNGVATLTTSSLTAGTSTITATYSGDSSYNTSSGTLSQTVSKNSPTLAVTTSGPSTYGQAVTVTGTLPAGVTGSIVFSSGATSLGSGTINASGIAIISTSVLPVGTDTITANYAGDTNNNSATGSTTQTVSKNTPTVTVATSGPSTAGSTVTVTATVPTGATGTITFTAGSTTIGSGTVNNGVVTITTSTLPIGTTTITASYGGDSNNNPATGSTTQTVSKASPVLNLASSLNPSAVNQSVTFTATLPSTATGSVTFTDGSTSLGTVSLVSGVATVSSSSLTVGAHSVSAAYSGDSNNNGGNASLIQTVNQNATTITVATSGPSTYGSTITVTATVPTGATGTVTFTSGGTTIGSGSVNPSTGTVVITTSTLPVGTNTITATYGGDTNYSSASGSTTQIVNKATPSITVTTSGPSTYGDPVIITTTVPPGTTGTVTVSSGGTTIGTGTINPTTGTATITTTTLPVGTDTITVNYGGDTNNNSATGSATQTVSKATPAVTLASSLNPSAFGQTVTLTATVPPSATGSITFTDGGTPLATVSIASGVATLPTSTFSTGTHTITAVYGGDTNNNGATSSPLSQVVNKSNPVLPPPAVSNPTQVFGSSETITEVVPAGVSGPVTFSNGSTVIGIATIVNGVATITVNNLPVGSNPITASTPGDANNNPATSTATIVTVTKSTPVLPPPVVSDANPDPGTPVTITEHVPADVTGSVTFSNGGTAIGSGQVVNGVATITVPSLPVGSNPITASVAETATTNAATSPATTVTVHVNAPTVALVSSVNPASVNQAITFTATVPAGATGTITFFDGAITIGSGAVNPAGIAAITTSTLTIGTHVITASYGGNTAYNAAVSAPLSQVIGKLPTTITLTTSAGTVMLNSTITFTAVVSSSAPTPTGTVTFLEGTTVLGSAPMTTNGNVVGLQLSGNAALALSSLSSGSHTVTAVYSGDSSFLTSSSAPVTSIIHDFTNKNTGDASHDVYPGDSAVYKFTLTPVGTATFLSRADLSVSGLPENASYTFSSTSVAAGAGTTEITLTVQTNKVLKTTAKGANRPLSQRGPSIALGLLGLVGLGALRRNRRKMPKLLVVLLLAGSLLPIASLTGCAGGFYAPTPSSYTVTVTGTEAKLQHSATAILTIQQ